METRELYEVLGLQPFADGAMVDQAYWHLAKSFQTLAVTDPRARQALDELNEAYGVLGTPRLREEYDVTLTRLGGQAAGRDASITLGGRASAGREGATKKRFGVRSFFKRKTPVETASSGDAEQISPAARESESALASPRRQSMRRSTSDVADLQASTGEMLKRWRANAGIEVQTATLDSEALPDTTLVDIFRTEQAVEDEQDPLNAVMDVLRASKDSVTVRP